MNIDFFSKIRYNTVLNDFPINYINNFKKNYKNEIFNIDEQVKEITKESNELPDEQLLTKN